MTEGLTTHLTAEEEGILAFNDLDLSTWRPIFEALREAAVSMEQASLSPDVGPSLLERYANIQLDHTQRDQKVLLQSYLEEMDRLEDIAAQQAGRSAQEEESQNRAELHAILEHGMNIVRDEQLVRNRRAAQRQLIEQSEGRDYWRSGFDILYHLRFLDRLIDRLDVFIQRQINHRVDRGVKSIHQAIVRREKSSMIKEFFYHNPNMIYVVITILIAAGVGGTLAALAATEFDKSATPTTGPVDTSEMAPMEKLLDFLHRLP